jgi:hypothetical protein
MTLADLSQRMGQLLGPVPIQEIVITRYEDDTINFQIEGMKGPVSPQDSYRLLAIVAQELTKAIAQEPSPKEASQ